jgi:[ribosomal protein S5]-alanine N-acetyltransferase
MIKTKRLVLRPYRMDDFEKWRDAYLGRLPSQNEFDEGRADERNFTRERFRDKVLFQQKARVQDKLHVFGVFDRKEKVVYGFIDIFILARLGFQYANLGFNIHNQYAGNGFAKEASIGAVMYAFKKLKLHRIEAGVDPKNKASVAVVKGIGMKKEGSRRGFVFEEGLWMDLDFYSVTAEDYGILNMKPTVLTDFRDNLWP